MAASSSSSFSLALLFSLKPKGTDLRNPQTLNCRSKSINLPVLSLSLSSPQIQSRHSRTLGIVGSVPISSPVVGTEMPEELVASILSKVSKSDRGVKLSSEEHEQVSEVAQQLQRFCVPEPVKGL
ncbi:hypothetical protein OROMI_008656 [Orobanche minor]